MYKNIWIILIVNLILALIQQSFLHEFFGGGFNPNLVLSLAFAFLLIEEDQLALISAIFGGLFLDLGLVSIIGLSPFIFLMFILFSQIIKRTVFRGVILQILLIIVSTVIYKIFLNFPELQVNYKFVVSGVLNSFISITLMYFFTKSSERFLSIEYRIKARR